MNRKKWGINETELLIKVYPIKTDNELLELFNDRTIISIKVKAKRLKLKKTTEAETKNRSLAMMGEKNSMFGKVSAKRGRTYEELYSPEICKAIKNKLSIYRKENPVFLNGDKNPMWGKQAYNRGIPIDKDVKLILRKRALDRFQNYTKEEKLELSLKYIRHSPHNTIINDTKGCLECKAIKDIVEFNYSSYTRCGLNNRCKECVSKHITTDKRKKEIAARKRLYYKKNKHIFAWRRLIKSTMGRLNQNKILTTFDLLGYTPNELKENLKTKFTEGMSWDNYGEWHIDHIKQVHTFNIDSNPKIVNSLDNLRPLWG